MADNNKDNVVQGLALSRKNLRDLIIIVILLSFGVNLLASAFFEVTSKNAVIPILTGIFICLTSIAYTFISLFGKRTRSHTYEAFLIDGPKQTYITPVPGYEIAEEIHRYIKGAFAENTALELRWTKYNESDKLMREAIEYFLLHSLSLHLSEYFKYKTFPEKNLATFGRKDIPAVLLTNTFLELFSRPMSNRPNFIGSDDDSDGGEVVFVIQPDGAFYSKFELTLPKGSKVNRPQENSIEIETKKLKIRITVHCDGASTVLPRNFEEYYLHLNPNVTYTPEGAYIEYSPLEVQIDIQITIKLLATLTSSGWDYERWIDSFLEKIEEQVSSEAFFNRIQWESNATLLDCLKSRTKAKNVGVDKSKDSTVQGIKNTESVPASGPPLPGETQPRELNVPHTPPIN